jgi:hypothetical protein
VPSAGNPGSGTNQSVPLPADPELRALLRMLRW